MLDIFCSCCNGDDDLRVVPSRLFPEARFIACVECRDNSYEPRPLIVLAILHGDQELAKQMIKDHSYVGARIGADEILELVEERSKRDASLTNTN